MMAWLRSGRAGRLAIVACAVLLSGVTLGVHWWEYPRFAVFSVGVDQQHYLDAAKAWSVLDLSAAHHHYPPGYALLAAPFEWVTPWQPFMLPDLACLLVSLVLFVRVAQRLTPGWGDAVPALCFLVTVLSGKWMAFWLWIMPWTSTGSAPLQYLSVLLALRFGERPGRMRAFLVGLAIALVTGFRPSDAAVLLATGAGYVAWVLIRDRAGVRVWVWTAAAAGLGLAVGLLPWIAAHLAIFGASPGAYVSKSTGIGLEWRLLPMRWVMLVIDPRPLLPEGAGIAEVLPWVIPGIAGLLMAMVPGRGRHVAPAVFVVATIALHWALYLAYRDLQPYGLWHFTNIHYFKWTLPFLMLGAVRFLAALFTQGERRRVVFAAVVTLLMFVWRPVLSDARPMSVSASGSAVDLPDGLSPLSDAMFLPLDGAWRALYFGLFDLRVGGAVFQNTRDFKVLPVPGGALVLPLRVLPFGPATLDLAADVTLRREGDFRAFTQAIRLGVPCGIFPRRLSCAWKSQAGFLADR